ncbi:MerR family transcriptional regulator [Deinococcus cellulosilyticus]|nr:helix-turn-helix domain-containing protein [Deinococcus cellulosilyticus]
MPMVKLLSIGQFARLAGLTPRMLRCYEQQGLLVPHRTDSGTGYRYYQPEQLSTAVYIRTLRRTDLGLKQIQRVLKAPMVHRLSLLQKHQANVEQKIMVLHQALEELRHLQGNNAELYPVTQATRPTHFSLSLQLEVTIDQVDAARVFALHQLQKHLQEQQLQAAGPPYAQYLLPSSPGLPPSFPQRWQTPVVYPMTFGVPVEQVVLDEPPLVFKQHPEVQVLSTLHFGGYEPIHLALQHIALQASQRDLQLTRHVREVYHLHALATHNSNAYQTELQVELPS